MNYYSGLGPKQVAWCDEWLSGFKTMRLQAEKAREQREESIRRFQAAAGQAMGGGE